VCCRRATRPAHSACRRGRCAGTLHCICQGACALPVVLPLLQATGTGDQHQPLLHFSDLRASHRHKWCKPASCPVNFQSEMFTLCAAGAHRAGAAPCIPHRTGFALLCPDLQTHRSGPACTPSRQLQIMCWRLCDSRSTALLMTPLPDGVQVARRSPKRPAFTSKYGVFQARAPRTTALQLQQLHNSSLLSFVASYSALCVENQILEFSRCRTSRIPIR